MPDTPPAPLDDRSLREAIDQSFALVAFQVNRHLVDHMLRMTRELGMDLESIVLWGVLAHLNVAHLLPPGTLPASVLDDQGHLDPPRAEQLRPLRLRDLAQITGIPRETIRRKLALLESAGRAQRSGVGWVVARNGVDPRIREFTHETVRRLLETARAVEATLSAAATPDERATGSTL